MTTTDTFFSLLAEFTARNERWGTSRTPVDPDWFWLHQIPETFCGEPLVRDSAHGDLSDVWVELSPGQEAFLAAAFPGSRLQDALRLALGPLPRS